MVLIVGIIVQFIRGTAMFICLRFIIKTELPQENSGSREQNSRCVADDSKCSI